MPPTTVAAVLTEVSSPIHSNEIDIQIEINELTTTSSSSTEARRKWLQLQKYNSNSINSKNKDNEFIDIDEDIGQEISGSGMDDNEDGDDLVTFIPLDTKSNSPYSGRPTGNTVYNTDRKSNSTSTISTDTTITPIVHSELTDGDISISGAVSDHTHSFMSGSKVSSYHIGSSVTQAELPDQDKCDRWLNCEDPFLKDYIKKFKSLPACPCKYPLLGINGIYDEHHKQIFKWRDSDYSDSYLLAYYKGASRCIRSEVRAGTLAAQNCCYDGRDVLITRGSGAGTPDVISPDVSAALHQLVDKMPWILCRGDWTKYNIARPPNNVKMCVENPPKMEYIYQIWMAKNQ